MVVYPKQRKNMYCGPSTNVGYNWLIYHFRIKIHHQIGNGGKQRQTRWRGGKLQGSRHLYKTIIVGGAGLQYRWRVRLP
jgi:hypothetical protein